MLYLQLKLKQKVSLKQINKFKSKQIMQALYNVAKVLFKSMEFANLSQKQRILLP